MALAQKIDYTLLSPVATGKDVRRLCEEARKYCFRAVCVAPTFVPLVKEILADTSIKVCTVVGFPLGFQLTSIKAREAAEVVASGADEIDMVINLRWVKEGRFEFVSGEINEVLATIPGTTVKVIIECGYLTREEKIELVDLLASLGVAYVKTSTGFGPSGATVEDVRLLSERAAGRLKVKAAGGIRHLDQALELLSAGADCLGTSSGVAILKELENKDKEEVEIFVDGACLKNPGPGGWAAIIRSRGQEKVLVGSEPHTTNNRMELLAAIRALEALKRPCKVKIYTDSRYLRDGITSWLPKWEKNNFKTSQGRPVKNKDLWQRLAALVKIHQVSWRWVPAHSGHPENERCDKLAREQARKQK